jgi:biotin carboxylase
MNAPKVLVINLGWEQRPLIDALAARGYAMYGIHTDASTVPGIEWREVLIADMRDLEAMIAFADRIAPDAVISDECDYAYFAQALLAERYSLPGPGLAAAQRATNKYLQRQAAEAGGIPVPKYQLCLSADEALQFAMQIGWPVILKPVDNRGSIGVSRADTAEQLKVAYTQALVNSHSRLVLVEQYIVGHHLTIDGYCAEGQSPITLAVGSNRKFDGELGIVNQSIIYPAEISPQQSAAASDLAVRTAAAMGYRFGYFHGEFIIENETGRLFLTEMANRGGGVHISNIAVPHVTQQDVVGRYIDEALGLPSDLVLRSPSRPRAALLSFFASQDYAGKKLLAVHGVDSVVHSPGMLCFQMFVRPGQTLGARKNSAQRHAMIIVGMETPEQLDQLADGAWSQLRLEVESI